MKIKKSIKKQKEEKPVDNTEKINELIYHAACLKDEITIKEAELKKIKAELISYGVKEKGNYIGLNNAVLKINASSNWQNPSSEELYDYMEKNNYEDGKFFACVKVSVKDTEEIIGKETFQSLRKELAPTLTFSFSK